MTRAEPLCRCGHYRDSHGSRTEHHNIVADECGICDDLSRAAEVGR